MNHYSSYDTFPKVKYKNQRTGVIICPLGHIGSFVSGNKQTFLKVNTKPHGNRVGRRINDFPSISLTPTGIAKGVDVIIMP